MKEVKFRLHEVINEKTMLEKKALNAMKDNKKMKLLMIEQDKIVEQQQEELQTLRKELEQLKLKSIQKEVYVEEQQEDKDVNY